MGGCSAIALLLPGCRCRGSSRRTSSLRRTQPPARSRGTDGGGDAVLGEWAAAPRSPCCCRAAGAEDHRGGLHLYDGHNHQLDLGERTAAVMRCWENGRLLRDRLVAAGLPVPRIIAGDFISTTDTTTSSISGNGRRR